MAGVEIVASSNEPGAAMNVRIRGVRSLTASNEPLYVVDGVPLGGGIQDFNPPMIESIDVLKDAAATAIYGSRGANGVILVTTKKGRATAACTRVHRRHVLRQSGAGSPHPDDEPAAVRAVHEGRRGARTARTRASPRSSRRSSSSRSRTGHLDGLAARRAPRPVCNAAFRAALNGSSGDTRYALNGNYFGQQVG